MPHRLIGFLKAAGVLMGAGLAVAGAVAGAKAHQALGNGPVLKQDAYRSQVRKKLLDRTGSVGGSY